MPIPTEAEFSAHLNALPPEAWARLSALLLRIQRHEGSFKFIAQPSGHYDSVRVVDDFFELVHELGLVAGFNWPEWEEGRAALLDAGTDFTRYDVETLCRFITTIVRADRFNDGFLVRCFENGQIAKILLALQGKVFLSS